MSENQELMLCLSLKKYASVNNDSFKHHIMLLYCHILILIQGSVYQEPVVHLVVSEAKFKGDLFYIFAARRCAPTFRD